MSPTLRLGTALSYGIDELTTRGGAILVAVYALVQVAAQVTVQSLFADLFTRVFPPDALPPGAMENAYPLALGIPLVASATLSLLLTVASVALTVLAVRAMYADADEFPTERHTRRLARTTAVAFVVGVVVGVAVFVGSLFLLLPGLFLAVALSFAHVVVAVEDAGVVESLRRSWSLTSGNRLRLFALGLIVFVAAGVVGAVFGLVGGFLPAVVGGLLTAAVIGLTSIFSIAVLVGAYVQLADAPPTTAAETGTVGF